MKNAIITHKTKNNKQTLNDLLAHVQIKHIEENDFSVIEL